MRSDTTILFPLNCTEISVLGSNGEETIFSQTCLFDGGDADDSGSIILRISRLSKAPANRTGISLTCTIRAPSQLSDLVRDSQI